MSEFRKSHDGGVRRSASAALHFAQKNLDEYYKERTVGKRRLDALESSPEQLKNTDRELSNLLGVTGASEAAKTPSNRLTEEEQSANEDNAEDEVEEFDHSPPKVTVPVLFPTTANKELYAFVKRILGSWEDSSKVEQRDCLYDTKSVNVNNIASQSADNDVECGRQCIIALSGIVNTLADQQELFTTDFSQHLDWMRLDDLFVVTDRQHKLFREMLGVTRVGGEERGAAGHTRVLEFLKVYFPTTVRCEEILHSSGIAKSSEHEDVFVWRGISRILHGDNLTVRLGELDSIATREGRVQVEGQFGGAESNVRSRKIDILHQLCPEGSKPIDLAACEAKFEAVSSETLQIQ
ncbi:hypothetical protein BGZ83_007774 [Gryganskiella cystojenkinii]|nr:hypothetical protein BGZ83_007774 [Gryganskiella cystojenkinii]